MGERESQYSCPFVNQYVRIPRRISDRLDADFPAEYEGVRHCVGLIVVNLLASSSPQSGLAKLWQRGRLDISMEALVLNAKFRGLFTEGELAAAEKRLREYGYDFTNQSVDISGFQRATATNVVNRNIVRDKIFEYYERVLSKRPQTFPKEP